MRKRSRLTLMIAALGLVALAISQLGKLQPHFVATHKCPKGKEEKNKFVIIITSHNDNPYVERNLRSVFEQQYSNFRILFIDNASQDGSMKTAMELTHDFPGKEKITFVSNATMQSPLYHLFYAIQSCDDDEIVILLDGKNWLSTPYVLSELDFHYQSESVWMAFGQEILYPEYNKGRERASFFRSLRAGQARSYGLFSNLEQEMLSFLPTFYAGLFKHIKMQDLLHEGAFITPFWQLALLFPLAEMARSHTIYIPKVMLVSNLEKKPDLPTKAKDKRTLVNRLRSLAPYAPLSASPKLGVKKNQTATSDLLVFSNDGPLQLFSFLESLKCYGQGFDQVHIYYNATSATFERGYELVKQNFPTYNFHTSEENFPLLLHTLLSAPSSDYITFANDQIVMKDQIHIPSTIHLLEKTGAYGFFFHLGLHLDTIPKEMISIGENCYIWQFSLGEKDWKRSNTLQMTLYRKEDVKTFIHYLPAHSAPKFCKDWTTGFDVTRHGLCYKSSKALEVPMQVIKSDLEEKIALYTKEELNDRLLEGFRMDIAPLYQMNNKTPQIEFYPFFLPLKDPAK